MRYNYYEIEFNLNGKKEVGSVGVLVIFWEKPEDKLKKIIRNKFNSDVKIIREMTKYEYLHYK